MQTMVNLKEVMEKVFFCLRQNYVLLLFGLIFEVELNILSHKNHQKKIIYIWISSFSLLMYHNLFPREGRRILSSQIIFYVIVQSYRSSER